MSKDDHYELKETLIRLEKALNDIRSYGIDKEVLIAFLIYKSKLSAKQIDLVLTNVDLFYDKTIGRMAARAL